MSQNSAMAMTSSPPAGGWDAFFGKFPDSSDATFGTLLGAYTIAELKDLIAAKDAEMNALAHDSHFVTDTWAKEDPMASDAWATDFKTLVNDYQRARGIGEMAIVAADGLMQPESMIVADGEYRGILSALNNQWQHHTNGPGSLGELRARLTNAGAQLSAYTVPQPKAGTDADINVFQAADVTIRNVIEPAGKAIQAGIKSLPWGTIFAGLGVAVALFAIVDNRRILLRHL